MTTLSEIVTRVQRRVIDLPSAVQTEVQTLVLEAHRYLQEQHNFKTQEAVASRTTTLNNPSLGLLPALFKGYRGLPWYTDDLGVNYAFSAVTHSEEDIRRGFHTDPNLNVGRPSVLLHKAPTTPGDAAAAQAWEVYPVPDGLAQTTTGEYAVRVPYWSYLAAPASSDWFTDNATEYLLTKATAEAFLLNWDEGKYAVWLQKAGGELARVINRDKVFRLSNVDVLVPYPGGRAPKLGR